MVQKKPDNFDRGYDARERGSSHSVLEADYADNRRQHTTSDGYTNVTISWCKVISSRNNLLHTRYEYPFHSENRNPIALANPRVQRIHSKANNPKNEKVDDVVCSTALMPRDTSCFGLFSVYHPQPNFETYILSVFGYNPITVRHETFLVLNVKTVISGAKISDGGWQDEQAMVFQESQVSRQIATTALNLRDFVTDLTADEIIHNSYSSVQDSSNNYWEKDRLEKYYEGTDASIYMDARCLPMKTILQTENSTASSSTGF